MPNNQIIKKLSSEAVNITSIKYEKQVDSLFVGFNFACFQIWNMKTLSIESSSEFGILSGPIIGFSLLEPQNDPKNCLYLMTAHSSLIENVPHLNKYKFFYSHFILRIFIFIFLLSLVT